MGELGEVSSLESWEKDRYSNWDEVYSSPRGWVASGGLVIQAATRIALGRVAARISNSLGSCEKDSNALGSCEKNSNSLSSW